METAIQSDTGDSIRRCDDRIAEAYSILQRIDGSTDPDHVTYAKILRSRIDVHLDLRNYYRRCSR